MFIKMVWNIFSVFYFNSVNWQLFSSVDIRKATAIQYLKKKYLESVFIEILKRVSPVFRIHYVYGVQ